MRELLTRLLDTIFPPEEHRERLHAVTDADFDAVYEPRCTQGVIVLGQYSNRTLQAAIHENKFRHSSSAARLLGRQLQRWLDTRSPVALVAVPLGAKRARERGHNQVESIISTLDTHRQVILRPLQRVRDTLPQSRLKKEARDENVRGAFTCAAITVPSHIHEIVLVDDVMTTGATLKEARAALAPQVPPNVRITLLALAH